MNEDLIYNLLYESGLLADGCWDKFDEYDKEALRKYTELLINEFEKCIFVPDGEDVYKNFLNKFGLE